MSLRLASNRNFNITFCGKYSRTVTVKTSDKTILRPLTIAARNSHQHLAAPRCLEVAVLRLAPMCKSLYTEKCARNRLFAVGVEQ